MKKALISTGEPVKEGFRVAQVVNEGQEFPVASGLFWVDCESFVEQDIFWYDPKDQQLKEVYVQVESTSTNGVESF